MLDRPWRPWRTWYHAVGALVWLSALIYVEAVTDENSIRSLVVLSCWFLWHTVELSWGRLTKK